MKHNNWLEFELEDRHYHRQRSHYVNGFGYIFI